MKFETPLIRGTLIKRYKRFLADIRLEDGREITAHCANTGAMTGLKDPGLPVWVEPNDDPKRKLKFSWKLVELPGGHFAGIDTAVPNRVVGEALRARKVPGLTGYEEVKPEQKYGRNSRIDFLLTGDAPIYVEVKNVHLLRSGTLAEFPDAVTTRGAKHLAELGALAEQGIRAVMLYFVQRTDCDRVAIADDIDPGYAAAFATAQNMGVEAMALSTRISPTGVEAADPLPVVTDRSI